MHEWMDAFTGPLGGSTAARLAYDDVDDDGEAVVELLTLSFEPGEAPGGRLVFRFAGDADLAVEVECIDLVLADVSEPWAAKSEPRHED